MTTCIISNNNIDFDNSGVSLVNLAATANTLTFSSAGGNVELKGVSEPTQATSVATKNYVDSISQGLDWQTSVRVATTGSGTLATSFANGQTVDGVTLSTGNRILIKNQVDASENGIYTVNASGAPSRTSDLANGSSAKSKAVFVEEGTTNSDNAFVNTDDSGSDVVGTDDLTFVQFSGAGQIIAGSALSKSGNQLDVEVDNSTIEVSGDALRVKDSGIITSKIADSNVTNVKLANSSIAVSAGDGLSTTSATIALGGSTTLSVNVDDSTIEINGDSLRVKDAGITTAKINDANITESKIATSAVTTSKIADSNVTTAKIADANVTTVKIADSNVTTGKIATSAVTTAKIADTNVTTSKIADSNVTTAKIADANVTNAKLANSSLTVSAGDGLSTTSGSIALGSSATLSVNVDDSTIEIDTDSLRVKANGINSSHINFGTTGTQVDASDVPINNYAWTQITSPSDTEDVLQKFDARINTIVTGGGSIVMSNGVATTGGVGKVDVNVDDVTIEVTGSVGSDSLNVKDSGITTAKIADANVTTAKIADSNVTTAKIADANVTNAKLANSSLTVTAGDGLQTGGSVSLGSSVTVNVDSTVVRTSGNQTVGGVKTFSNTTSSTSTSTGAIVLPAGGIGLAGSINAGGSVSATSFTATSDARKKTDIVSLDDSLSVIEKINPVSFKWADKSIDDDKHYGVIAQEIKQVLPELVKEDSEGYFSVDYLGLVGHLLSAVKELSAKVKELS